MNSKLSLLIAIVLVAMFIGCSQGTDRDPVNNAVGQPITGSANPDYTGSLNHYLWGLWRCDIDPGTGKVEIVPLRGAEFHVNVTGRLQAPAPTGLGIVINKFEPANALIDLDLTITHPYPNSNFRGFDVRGIVMGAGNVISSTGDPSLVFTAPAPGGFRIENADGYTRWWNPTEFGTAGLYGFVTGALGSKVFKPLTTLNPYKYFADPLTATDPVTPLVNSTNRGTFSTAPNTKLTRNYILRFPKIGGNPVWTFQYAVDASWAPPTGGSDTPKPIDDYPILANCPEAYHITVDSSKSTAYYIDGGNLGGDLTLDIEVFDWGAPSNFKGIDGEIDTIDLESDTLFDGVITVLVKALPGTQDTSGIYSITIPNVHPSSVADQEVLVTVNSKSPTSYKPPITGPKYPQAAKLAAYTVTNIPILNVNPQENKLTVTSPNGGEVWDAGSAHDITWSSIGTVGNNVKIEYKVGNGTPVGITDATPNDSVFPWNPLPSIDSNQVKIIVTSVDDPLIWDDSDDFFTIGVVGTITVTSPNGGEVVDGDWKWDIKWDSTGPVSNVKIEFSKDSGATYPDVIIDSTPNTGLYTWDPTPYINKNTCRIKITDVDNATVYDESDADFSITQMGDSITVIQPDGGEVLQAGGSYEIKWDWVGNIPVVNIFLSTDSGATWPVTIAQLTECDGSYIWDPIPDIETTKARIKISTADIPMKSDTSDADFTITSLSTAGWNSVPGQTQVALTDPAPLQGTGPVDLMVFSAGAGKSRGEIVNQGKDSVFYKYNDDYSGNIGTTWKYPVDPGPIHKFDVLPDGSYAFVTLVGTDPWSPPEVNDPAHGVFSSHDNSNGDSVVLYFGDSGDPDPDEVPWFAVPDFSCGVPKGTEDNRAYFFRVISPVAGNPGKPDGNIGLLYWAAPFDADSINGWNVDISTQGGGQGLVDDTDPNSMALAADDATGMGIGGKPVTALWILDSKGKAQCVVMAWETGDAVFMDTQLTSKQYGSRTPIDFEIVNALDFGYIVTDPGFNWLAVLLDNGNGTWSVGVWEYNYLAGPPATFTQIDITDPLPGTPMALDVDPVDFEIHVLAQNKGNIEATVFNYTP